MKLFENISNGYKRIATGIAIVTFLSILYIALIPAGSVATVYGTLSNEPIVGAIVKIVEYPQYNTTTDGTGAYTLNNVPYDNVTGSTYTLRISAPGYGSNTSSVTLTEADPLPAVSMKLNVSEPFYIPFLDDRGTTYEAFIQVFNPYNFNTTADVTVYNNLTGLNRSTAFEIPVNNLGSSVVETAAGGGSFVGAAKIENTRPQSLVQGLIRSILNNTYTISPSRKLSTETVQYLTFLDDRGTTYDAQVQIFNPYDNNITADLTAYNNLTGVNTTLSLEIPAKSYRSRYAADIAGGAVGSNVNFVGTVKVNTSQPAQVQGMVRTIQSKTYSMATAVLIPASTVQYLPYLDDRGTTYDAQVQIFNPYDNNITAELTGYNNLTGVNTTLSLEIPAKSYRSRYAGEIAGGAVGSNINFVGTVKVNTSQPALVQGMVRTIQSKTYSMAPSTIIPAETVQYLPFLNDTGTTFDAMIQVFNPYDNSITADLTGYNLLNGQTTTLSFEIPAKSYRSRYAGEIAGGADGANVDFLGSVKVNTSQPVPVQGMIRTTLSKTITLAPSLILQ